MCKINHFNVRSNWGVITILKHFVRCLFNNPMTNRGQIVRYNPVREVPNIWPIAETYPGYKINIKILSRQFNCNKLAEPASLMQFGNAAQCDSATKRYTVQKCDIATKRCTNAAHCRSVAMSCVLPHCRSVALCSVLSHCRVWDSDSARCPILATIYSSGIYHIIFESAHHSRGFVIQRLQCSVYPMIIFRHVRNKCISLDN